MKLGFLFAFVLVALVAFGQPAFAAKPAHAGKPAPSGTIAVAAGYTPALGQDLLFDATTANLPGWANPRINVFCYQDGVLVYGEARNAENDGGYLGQPFKPLGAGSSQWKTNGGPADCVAELFYWDQHLFDRTVLASVSFAAGG